MKTTSKISNKHNLASSDERGENFIIDLIFSSSLAITIVYFTCSNLIIAFLAFFFIRFLYYFSFEYYFGRTLGKYQTQTIVVDNKNGKPSILQLVNRNLIRFISLISTVGDNERALHDNLSNTFVIKNEHLKRINFWSYRYLLYIPLYSYSLYHFLGKQTSLNITQKIFLIIFIFGFLLIFKLKER